MKEENVNAMNNHPTPWRVFPDDVNCRAVIRDANFLPVVYITDPIRPRALEDAQMIADAVNENVELKKQLSARNAGEIRKMGDRYVKVSDLRGVDTALMTLERDAKQLAAAFETMKKRSESMANAVDCAIKRLQFLTETGMWLMPAENVDPSVMEVKR